MPGRGGHTEFTAGGTFKIANRLQPVPFQPVTHCRRGESDKLLHALNPSKNIFLSNHHYELCRAKAGNHAHHLCQSSRSSIFAGYDGFIRKIRRTTIRYEISNLREFGLGRSGRSQQTPDRSSVIAGRSMGMRLEYEAFASRGPTSSSSELSPQEFQKIPAAAADISSVDHLGHWPFRYLASNPVLRFPDHCDIRLKRHTLLYHRQESGRMYYCRSILNR